MNVPTHYTTETPHGRKLRVLFASDAAWANSGYAVQTALYARYLKDHCDLALLATFGLHGGVQEWEGIPVFPGGADAFANDVIPKAARAWNADIVITLKDTVVFRPEIFQGLRWLPMVPIDHDPAPPAVIERARASYRPIAYAPQGFRALRKAGLDPLYAPHAYDPKVYYPMDKAEARKALNLPPDLFIVGTCAVNRGGIPSRKAWVENLEAFARFAVDKPNVRYFLHTDLARDGHEAGIPLEPLFAEMGILGKVLYCDQERYRYGGFPTEYMRAYYNCLDVLNAVSLGEGFGIPTLEAQACFPAHVPVAAGDVARASMTMYSGELITIETERGTVIDVTSEHPFWTERGWVAAKDLDCECRLLYTGEYEKELNNLHTGRIGDVAAALCDDAALRAGAPTRQDGWLNQLATASHGVKEILCEPDRIEIRYKYADRASVFGGADRWRGNGIYPQDGRRQVEAAYSDSEQFYPSDGLDDVQVFGSIGIHREAELPARKRSEVLYVPYTGDFMGAPLRSTRPLYGVKTRAYDVAGRVLTPTPQSGTNGRAYSTPIGDYRTHQGAQYEAIRSISRRTVTNLPVYNLTTASSTYVAAGYLVHNCGVPVIVGDWCAQEDLCFGGWKVGKDEAHHFYDNQQGWVYLPSPIAIANRMHEARRLAGSELLRDMAECGAAPYQIETVINDHWLPLLDEVAADVLIPRSRGVLRIIRPEEILGRAA